MFYFFFSNLNSFYFFSALIAVAETSKTMFNSSGENGHSCSWLWGKCFQFFTIEDNVGCGFIIYGFYYIEVCSFYAWFLEGFYHKLMLNFVKGFLCICCSCPFKSRGSLFRYGCCCSLQVEKSGLLGVLSLPRSGFCDCRQPAQSSRAPSALHCLQVARRFDQTETVGAVCPLGDTQWLVGPLFLMFSAQTR